MQFDKIVGCLKVDMSNDSSLNDSVIKSGYMYKAYIIWLLIVNQH